MIVKGNLYKFVGEVDETTGIQVLTATIYIGKICQVVDICEGEIYCRVVFTRDNGSKYYSDIGKSFLEELKRETRRKKLDAIESRG